MADKKYLNLDPNVLMEWEYSSTKITENYTIWSDLSKNTRNFLSTTSINDINHNLFLIDPATKKYSKIDITKFNVLRLQNYNSAPIYYDKVTLYFPTIFNFGVYYGFYLKIMALDYLGKKSYPLANFYFDKSQAININGTVEYADSLMNLGTPFTYNQKEWGKYLTFYVPSVYSVANQRLINPDVNITEPNTINYILTEGTGLNTNAPIYVEFSYISSKQTIFDVPYFWLSDTYKTTLSLKPEYQSLGVMIEESTQGDFFEIYGVYDNANQSLDDFVDDLESKGRKINIEYIITLYEENLISGYPVTILVTENFSQKIEYRPIIKYSNTTAAIDVEMRVVDLVDSSSFSRFASIGLTKNLLKYGKTLSRLNVDNLSKPKIYNYKYDKVYDLKTTANVTDISIVKVPFPVLINTYKVMANNFNSNNGSDYKSMGLLNIIITPFDNIVKFQIAKQDSPSSPITPFNLSELMLNAKLNLVFKSDSKTIEKDVYFQTDENKFELGVVVFKVNQEDIPLLKQMNKEKSDNFYLILNSNKTKTLIYSGKFKIFENLKFLGTSADVTTTPVTTTTGVSAATASTENAPVDLGLVNIPSSTGGATPSDAQASAQIASTTSAGVNDVMPPQFSAESIPTVSEKARTDLDQYRNAVIWVKAGISNIQIDAVISRLNSLGIIINYAYQTPENTGTLVLICGRVPMAKTRNIVSIPNIINVKLLTLDFGWQPSSDKVVKFDNFGTTGRIISSDIQTKADENLNSSAL